MRLIFPLVLSLSLMVCTVKGQEPNGQVYGFVSFSTDRVEVHEDSGNAVTTVQLPLIREVGTTGIILATVEVWRMKLVSMYNLVSNAIVDRWFSKNFISRYFESSPFVNQNMSLHRSLHEYCNVMLQ